MLTTSLHWICLSLQKRRLFSFTVLCALALASLLMPASAAAPFADPNAYVTTDLNLRAGPDTDFPAIVVIPQDEYVTVYACIEDLSWCDVSYAEYRGWVAADYIRPFYQSRFMTVQEYAPLVVLPSAPFDIKLYWTSFYRDQPFFAELDQWAAPRREPAFRTNSFYQPLASYGDWVDVEDEYVWVPRNVDHAWRPYTRGRWVNTDQYGWFWESDEPFGWATYHYGRWGFSHDVGWYWVPATRWAPAWVAWRGSDDYVGWAPLPPASDSLNVSINIGTVPDYYWQVVPARSFLDVNLSASIFRGDDRQFRPMFERTRPLGNVTIVNNVVVNNVVNVQYVEQRTRRKVIAQHVAAAGPIGALGPHSQGRLGVFSPPPARGGRPPGVRRLQEVAAYSKTKGQALGGPATGPMAFHKKSKVANLGGPAARACPGGKVFIGNQCRCPPGLVGNGQGVCVSPAQLAAGRGALQAGGTPQCTGGKVLVGNQCRCPPGLVGNGQGVCVSPAQLAAGRAALQAGGAPQCTGGKVLVGNQCRCPPRLVGNGQGVCVSPAQLAARRAALQAGGAPQCTGGKVLVGKQCRCPPGLVGNGLGVCISPAQFAARRAALQAGGTPQCTGGKVLVGNQCSLPGPGGLVGNGARRVRQPGAARCRTGGAASRRRAAMHRRQGSRRQPMSLPGRPGRQRSGVCISPAQLAARRAALQAGGAPQCTGGKVLVGNQCRCPAGLVGNGLGVCISPAQLAARQAALQAGGTPQCTGGKVLVGNQCHCPPGLVGNGQGVCVSPAQLAARRATLQAGGTPQCTGGKVLVGKQCRCPPGLVGNGRGVCISAPR